MCADSWLPGYDNAAAMSRRCGCGVMTPPISQPDGPGEAIGTFRLVGYSPEAIVDCGAFGCENGLRVRGAEKDLTR
jgi:hypothetical protein